MNLFFFSSLSRIFPPRLVRRRLACALLLTLALPARSYGEADAASEVKPESLETLSQSQLQEVFRVLNRHYIENETLNYEALNRAALDGLLRRLSFGATLVRRNGDPDSDAPAFSFHEEVIKPGIAYLRPVTFEPKEVEAAAKALRRYPGEEIHTLILDLRAPVRIDEFGRAAAFLDLFTGRNQLLFKIQKPSDQRAELFLSKKARLWDGRLVVLVDRESSSVAETVAAVLDHYVDCLTMGQPTQGRTVQYQEVALDEETALRFASAEVLLPDDRSLFRKGITPRLRAGTSPQRKRRVFEQSAAKGMQRFVFDRERPRLNEAALIAGDDPELDYHLAKSAGKPTPYDKTPLRDGMVQQALETLLAVDFFQLEAKAESGEVEEEQTEEEESPAAGAQEEDGAD